MKSHERTFAKVDQAVHDNIVEVLITGSLSYLYSWLQTALFYLHRGTSLIGSCQWHHRPRSSVVTCFSGRAALGLSFREHKRRNGQICPFSFEDIILLTVDTGRVIFNHRDSSRVGSCQRSVEQFAGWISPIPLRLIISISKDYSTAVNKVWCLQCGQMF